VALGHFCKNDFAILQGTAGYFERSFIKVQIRGDSLDMAMLIPQTHPR
jgi:hypothetical protein